ncbi:WG repeat-containing protein [Actinoplanes sp. CA-252034]|uniref:WG repeat-containing protein n=1 Tax=Actinoplanes sp. CA-252034 TaxID=3239906 RepID=UPI003D995493
MSEDELDLTRTMQIVRIKAAATEPAHKGGSAADQDDAVTEPTDEEPTAISVFAAGDGHRSPEADASAEPDTATISAEPETAALSVEPDTAALSVEPDTAALSVEPETAALSVEPETVALSVEPNTVLLTGDPQTIVLGAEPETILFNAEPETVALRPEAEVTTLRPEPETAALHPEPETVTLHPEPETAALHPEPETAAPGIESVTTVLSAQVATTGIAAEATTTSETAAPESVAGTTEAETTAEAAEAKPVTGTAGTTTVAEADEAEVSEARDGDAGSAVADVPDRSGDQAGTTDGRAGGTTATEPAAVDPAGSDDVAGDDAEGASGVPLQGVTSETAGGSAAETSGSRIVTPEAEVVRAEPVRQRRDQRASADRRRADPEQALAAYSWTYDPQTLREQVDEPDRLWDVADRLTDRLEFAERDNVRAGLLSLRAVVHRIVGELDDALADGREGLRHAEASGELRITAIAQARLAHVLQWRGEFEEADRLYADADSPELPPRTRAEICELAGRSAYEQGRYLEAVNLFERALDVRRGEDPEMVERIELALDAISRRSGAAGWGPYPRTRDEVLGLPDAPVPLLDDGAGLWGYAAAVEPRFVEAQPFAEGAAWVRRPESAAWELIDASGELIIVSAHGYVGVTPFAEGLAWVTRQDQGGWFAIDRENRLVVPAGGFEDARPFRRGLAVVRQGGAWGAVDRHGRFAVTPSYQRFVTALHVGGEIDGFTDDGLAVVDAGDRFGVVDRAGRTVVEPVHAAVVIHPVAFLVRDAAGLWGALDRSGAPLVDIGHRDREAVVEALPEENRPVL